MTTAATTENGDFTIPWLMDRVRKEEHYRDLHRASERHLKAMVKAQRTLASALDHLRVLLGYFRDDDGGSMSTRAETVLLHVEKLAGKVRNHMDRQEIRDSNLFIAYFDLKAGRESAGSRKGAAALPADLPESELIAAAIQQLHELYAIVDLMIAGGKSGHPEDMSLAETGHLIRRLLGGPFDVLCQMHDVGGAT